MATKAEMQDRLDRMETDLSNLLGRSAGLSKEVARRNRALDAGTRRYGRETLRARILQKRAEDAGAVREQTVEQLGRDVDFLQEQLGRDVDFLQEKLREERHHERRARRALYAGARRYAREQQRAEQLELAGQEQALLHLQAVADSREAHKIMHAARMRGDKLAAKLVLRAGELGKERQAWVGHIAGRERALENANKRARGLQESLRKAKTLLAEERRTTEGQRQAIRISSEEISLLRQKLRTANSSVIMEALGGGLEIRPMSGLQNEDATGYTQAALWAARRARGQL